MRITEGVDAEKDITGLWSDGDYMWVLIAHTGREGDPHIRVPPEPGRVRPRQPRPEL